MFDLVINIFIILFIIFFTSIIIQKQQQGDTLEEIWQKYQNKICITRTTLKIIGIIFICWLSTVHLMLGILTAILLIVIMEYDYNNEIDKTENFQSIDKTNTGDTYQNKLHKKKNKIDYFVAEKSIRSKPSSSVDKALFKSSSDIKPYDTNINLVSI